MVLFLYHGGYNERKKSFYAELLFIFTALFTSGEYV